MKKVIFFEKNCVDIKAIELKIINNPFSHFYRDEYNLIPPKKNAAKMKNGMKNHPQS